MGVQRRAEPMDERYRTQPGAGRSIRTTGQQRLILAVDRYPFDERLFKVTTGLHLKAITLPLFRSGAATDSESKTPDLPGESPVAAEPSMIASAMVRARSTVMRCQ
jgi:hypothetical protein